jgi:hypothetical protein
MHVAVTGGDVVEGLVVLRAAGDLVDSRVGGSHVFTAGPAILDRLQAAGSA